MTIAREVRLGCSWNAAAEALFGYVAGEVLRRNIADELQARDAVGMRARERLRQATRRQGVARPSICRYG